jgi:hypothetical protein
MYSDSEESDSPSEEEAEEEEEDDAVRRGLLMVQSLKCTAVPNTSRPRCNTNDSHGHCSAQHMCVSACLSTHTAVEPPVAVPSRLWLSTGIPSFIYNAAHTLHAAQEWVKNVTSGKLSKADKLGVVDHSKVRQHVWSNGRGGLGCGLMLCPNLESIYSSVSSTIKATVGPGILLACPHGCMRGAGTLSFHR